MPGPCQNDTYGATTTTWGTWVASLILGGVVIFVVVVFVVTVFATFPAAAQSREGHLHLFGDSARPRFLTTATGGGVTLSGGVRRRAPLFLEAAGLALTLA